MKRILGVVIGLGVIIGLGYALFAANTVEVTNDQTVATSTDAVSEPSAEQLLEAATQKMITEAITASSSEIEAAKVAAASEVEKRMQLDIEREVRAKLQASNNSRMIEIDKETKVYWRDKANVVALIKQYFPDEPVMISVAKGESGLRQWKDDGTLVRGHVDPRDSGLFQINSGHWDTEAKRLGLDYKNSIEDNVKMARHIVDVQGITAWVYYNQHLAIR